MEKIILASTSPRRKELLALTGLKFKAFSPDYEEDMSLPLPPHRLAAHLSRGKAEAVAKKFPQAIIVAADTFIVLNNRILGKPHTRQKAAAMLRQISGKSHLILTGLAIVRLADKRVFSEVVETKIRFKRLSKADIEGYIKIARPLDKAGAYAIQDLGGMFIDRIEGDFSGAIGLPLGALVRGLNKFKINIFV